MDTWHAINEIMCWIDGLGYKFVCPIRSNRLVLDQSVKDLPWEDKDQLDPGKLKECRLKLHLFRLTDHPNRTN